MSRINSAQRNFIHASLQSFEETLAQAEHWLAQRTETGALYRYHLHLTPEREAEVRQMLRTARAEIAALSARLGLNPREESVNRLLAGRCSQCWAELADTHPQRQRLLARLIHIWLKPMAQPLSTWRICPCG